MKSDRRMVVEGAKIDISQLESIQTPKASQIRIESSQPSYPLAILGNTIQQTCKKNMDNQVGVPSGND